MKHSFHLGLALLLVASPLPAEPVPPVETDYYRITPIPMPEGEVMEVGAIDFGPDGRVYLSTRRGDIWSAGNVLEYPAREISWKLFARYLHEPLGLAWQGDWLYAVQRPEVTRLKDVDGDGRADLFECVSDDWGISGDYHEYAFGSRFDPEGNLWVALCLTGSFRSEAPFRGWVLRIAEDGTTTPAACGVRSPGGIGFGPGGEVFYTDNQGAWNGSSSLKHVAAGSFQGNPNGNVWFPLSEGAIGEAPPFPENPKESRTEVERETIPTYVPPAIVLPHQKVGQSPTGMILDESGGRFGPFEGQLFVGEQTYSNIQRCFLEEINGVWQGAVFPFLSGFQSGNIAIQMKDGVLVTGGSNRGWGARGGQPFNFEKVEWTGRTPFEVHEMRARSDGFELTFTEAVDPASIQPGSLAMKAYTYMYRADYGSPEVDPVEPVVTIQEVSADGKRVRIGVEPLTRGHVHELRLDGVRNGAGLPLLHPVGYYTLNEIPPS